MAPALLAAVLLIATCGLVYELVAGALLYTRYNFLVRFVMRQITKAEGGDTDTSRDYEYTDWDAVDRFAEAFARQLRQPY